MLLQKKEFGGRPFLPKGSMILALVITMLFFSVLVVAMLSTMGSSIFNQLNTAATTKATYIAKSGNSYLASQYKNVPLGIGHELAVNQVFENLNSVNYQLLNNAGSFILNIQPSYLRSLQAKTINASTTLNVKFPGAVPNTTPAILGSGTMAVYTQANGWLRFSYTGVTTVSANNYTLTGVTRYTTTSVPVSIGTGILPVLTLAPAIQTLTNSANNSTVGFTVATGTGAVFPARFGFFEIPLADTTGHVYYYDHRTGDTFYGIHDFNRPTRTFSYTTTATTGFIYAHTAAQINSTGTFNTGSGSAVTPVSNTYSRMAILGYTPGGNSDYATPYTLTGTGGFIPVGTGVTVTAASNTITLGGGATDTGGVAWYAGNSDAAYCVNGICNAPYGIRAYFTFADSYTGTSHGDGFTFTIMNGANNDASKRGGPPGITGMGELMAYAGPGNTITGATAPLANPPLDGLGLEPPKMAIEFDKYQNAGITSAGCSNGRNDAANNHMALMLWGANTAGNCATGTTLAGYPAASCDDNIHGAGTVGSSTIPANSASGDGTGGYYDLGSTTYLNTTASHTARIEVTRDQTTNGNGNYNYNVQAWIDCTTCNDVTVQYTTSIPQINRTIELSPALHANFSTLLFGFTQSTGAATQNITISNFAIYFTPY